MNTLSTYAREGQALRAANGTCLFEPGAPSEAFLILQSGTVRVEQTNEAGRTVVLYRLRPGDSCVLTTTCLLSDRPYTGYGYAEGDVDAIAIPPARFHELIRTDVQFQQLVFEGFAQRVSELTDVIDALLLHRTDLRLARWLADQGAGTLNVTQKDIAQEIGTVREVVSRVLKDFETRGWIAQSRGAVQIIAPEHLRQHATDK